MADFKVTADYTDLQTLRRELLGAGKDAERSASIIERAYSRAEKEINRTANASQQYYNDILGVDRATKSAYKSSSAFRDVIKAIDQDLAMAADATQDYYNSLLGVDRAQKSARDSASVFTQGMNTGAIATNRFGGAVNASTRRVGQSQVVIQQAGYQIGDFIVQVQSGTNAFVAFGQQATQVAGTLTMFGGRMLAVGAALSVAIPLATALAAAFVRTRETADQAADAMDDARESLSNLRSEFDLATSGFASLEELTLFRNFQEESDKLRQLQTQLDELGSGQEGVRRGRTLRNLIEQQTQLVEGAKDELEQYRLLQSALEEINDLSAERAEREESVVEQLFRAREIMAEQEETMANISEEIQLQGRLQELITTQGENSAEVEELRRTILENTTRLQYESMGLTEKQVDHLMAQWNMWQNINDEATRLEGELGRIINALGVTNQQASILLNIFGSIANFSAASTVSQIMGIANALGVATARAIELARAMPGYTGGGVSGPDAAIAQVRATSRPVVSSDALTADLARLPGGSASLGGGSGGGGGGGSGGGQSELDKAFEDIQEAIGKAWEEAREELEKRQAEWRETGVDLIGSFIDGMSQGDLPGALDNILGQAQNKFFDFMKQLGSAGGRGFGDLFSSISRGFGTLTSGGGLGSIFGGIGQIASGAMPIIGGISTAINLFKGFSSKEKVGETVETQGFLGAGGGLFQTIEEEFKKTSFWGLKTSREIKTSFRELNEETQEVRSAWSQLISGIDSAGGPLGVIANNFRKLRIPIVDGDISGALDKADAIIGKMIPGLSQFAAAGETTTDTLTRLSDNLTSVNSALASVGIGGLGSSVTGGGIATSILSRTGDLSGAAGAFREMLNPRQQMRLMRREIGTRAREFNLPTVTSSEQLVNLMNRLRRRGNREGQAGALSLAPFVQELEDFRQAIKDNRQAVRESERAAKEAAQAERDLARERINQERNGLLIQLYNLQGRIDKARNLEVKALDKSNHSLQRRIWKLQDEQAVQQERLGLETQLLQLQGNIGELRRRELEALDPTNRELQKMIWGLEDAQKAMEALDPTRFVSKFLFEQAKARVRRGVPVAPNMPSVAPAQVPDTATELVTTNLGGLQAIKDEVNDMKTVMTQLLVDIRRNVKKDYELKREWDAVGLPPTRT